MKRKFLSQSQKKRHFRPEQVVYLDVRKDAMQFQQRELRVLVGRRVRVVFRNPQEMPHNVVFIKGDVNKFGAKVDKMLLTNPKAAQLDYIPQKTKVVIAASKILNQGGKQNIDFVAPKKPGRYPFVCTFPGHWRIMQGVLVVHEPKIYFKGDTANGVINIFGGIHHHNFFRDFAKIDGGVINKSTGNAVFYTQNQKEIKWDNIQTLVLCNNKPFHQETKKKIFDKVNSGMGLLILHASTWQKNRWKQYNQVLVGGQSRSHEKYGNFDVIVTKPTHPIMEGVSSKFVILDELFRFQKLPKCYRD